MPSGFVVFQAVAAAIGAAACFAASAALQQSAAQRASAAKALHAALLVDLVQRRSWLVGFAAAAGGFLLQGVALHFGCLALVQPLILLDLVIAPPLSARLGHHVVLPRQWLFGLLIAASVGVLLVAGEPHGGHPDIPAEEFAVLTATIAAAVGICVFIARRAPRLARVGLFATSAGLLFGLLAVVLDNVTFLLAHRGALGTLARWQPYLLAVVAPAGEVFAQSAYQAGPLTVSSPVMNTVEPGSAIAIGLLVFGEHIDHTPAAIAVQVLAALGVVAGVLGLSHVAALPDKRVVAPARAASDTPCQVDQRDSHPGQA